MAIHIHFAGSYLGGVRFEIPEVFNADLVFCAYDRDEDVAKAGWPVTDARELFFGALLSDTEKTVDFYKNVDIFTSSYLKTNQHWPDLYHPASITQADYLITDAGATDAVLPLQTTTLDLIAARHNAPVDALMMDTQGAELDILKGGTEQLRTKTLAVFTEIGMGPLYEGQPMFWELASWLQKSGFLPTSIYPAEWSPYRGRMGWRGKVFDWAGDAMFLKDIDHVTAHHADPRSDLRKLSLFAMSSGYVEYAIEALRRSEGYPAPETPETAIYDKFLDQLARLDATAPEPHPITSVDTRGLPFDARHDRYVKSGKSDGLSTIIKRLSENKPDPFTLLLQRFGFDHITQLVESSTRRDVIATLRSLGYDPDRISQETLDSLK